MDANAKIGLMREEVSRNGRLMIALLEECEMEVMNERDICQGTITRQNRRKEVEKSAIDLIIASYEASSWFSEMKIDEIGEYRIRNKNDSDHNTIIANIKMGKLRKDNIDQVTDWNFKAPEEKWEEFRNELGKSLTRAKGIMEDKEIDMTERYVSWEKLIYKAAMKTIGKTTFRNKGIERPSENLKQLRKERGECKKDFEREADQDQKGEKLKKYREKQNEIKNLIEEEEKERVMKRFKKMESKANKGGFWRERRLLNKEETSNWQTTKDPEGKRILDPRGNKENIARYYEDL